MQRNALLGTSLLRTTEPTFISYNQMFQDFPQKIPSIEIPKDPQRYQKNHEES